MALAQSFVTGTGTTFTMLWDSTSESWRHYGVQRNSDLWLLDPNGNRVGERFYRLDENYVEELLAGLA